MRNPSGVRVETDLGPIFINPLGLKTVSVSAPNLTAGGIPLRAAATLVSDDGLNFDLIQTYDRQVHPRAAEDALTAQRVDGRSTDIVTLGKIASVIVSAVRKLAQNERQLFLEAERQAPRTYIADLEGRICARAKAARTEKDGACGD